MDEFDVSDDESNLPVAVNYELMVLQQPQRCRVCGVTEKDRRPIDPPIIVQVIAKDAYGNVLTEPQDWHMLVMHAALYTEDGVTECTIMRSIRDLTRSKVKTGSSLHSSPASASASGGTATLSSADSDQRTGSNPASAAPTAAGVSPTAAQQQQEPFLAVGPQQQSQQSQQLQATAPTVTTPHPFPFTIPANPYSHPPLPPASTSTVQAPPLQARSGYTIHSALDLVGVAGAVRVLMGSLVASCHRVMGMDGETGLFFAFQDVSLRYEGTFRLQFRLFNLADVADAAEDGQQQGEGEEAEDAFASAPALATVMTDVFTAYSAKKFPGMLESTEISKHFANQGIKLPTRSEPRRGQAKRRARGQNDGAGGGGAGEEEAEGGDD